MGFLKVFISQIMTDRKEEVIMEERTRLIRAFQRVYPEYDNFCIIDNYNKDTEYVNNKISSVELSCEDDIANRKRLVYLGDSITLMAEADVVLFSDNFKNSFGCTVESMICDLYGMKYCIINDEGDIINDHFLKKKEAEK